MRDEVVYYVYYNEEGDEVKINLSECEGSLIIEFHYNAQIPTQEPTDDREQFSPCKRSFIINPQANDMFLQELDLAIDKLNLMTGITNLYRLGENGRGLVRFALGQSHGYYWNEDGQWICKGPMLFTWKNTTVQVNESWITPLSLVSLLEHLKVIKAFLRKTRDNY